MKISYHLVNYFQINETKKKINLLFFFISNILKSTVRYCKLLQRALGFNMDPSGKTSILQRVLVFFVVVAI